MDLNGDGRLDILSGSYSRHDPDMAGLFQVLYAQADKTFAVAQALNGSDGKPLILQKGKGGDVDVICTRQFACDLDGDGNLDLVSGNFGGTFAWFRGEGGGKFAPESEPLPASGKSLKVPHHSDPFLVDWDADGDLDLLSGSADGGVFLFANEGSATAPKFGKQQTLVKAAGHSQKTVFGDAHLQGPQSSTRVWADDVDGDGKLDLLVGDSVTVNSLVEGVDEKTALARLAEWEQKQQKLFASTTGEQTKEQREQFQKAYEALEQERATFMTQRMTGFVWLLRQK